MHRSIATIGLLLALSGCISFGSDPPDKLLTLTPLAQRQAASTQSAPQSATVMVELTDVPQELRVTRVPVRTGHTELAYLKNAQWVEQPAALFSRLLTETIAASGRVVLNERQVDITPGVVLSGQLQTFGINADAREAVAVYDAVMSGPENSVRTRRFQARVPMTAIDAANAGPALNQAANEVARQVAGWLNGN